MIKEQLYNKTVDILVQAYFNDTLIHGNCASCAVGNIVAHNMGYTYTSDKKFWECSIPNWYDVFRAYQKYEGKAKKQIDSTGYTWQELAKVEKAFESAGKGNSGDDYMFNGLMAVIDVLDIIHENTDEKATTETKKRFVKQQPA